MMHAYATPLVGCTLLGSCHWLIGRVVAAMSVRVRKKWAERRLTADLVRNWVKMCGYEVKMGFQIVDDVCYTNLGAFAGEDLSPCGSERSLTANMAA